MTDSKLGEESNSSRSNIDTDYNYNGHNNSSKYDDSSTSPSLNHTDTNDSYLDSNSTGVSSNSLQKQELILKTVEERKTQKISLFFVSKYYDAPSPNQ
jgi:hypothetical protein